MVRQSKAKCGFGGVRAAPSGFARALNEGTVAQTKRRLRKSAKGKEQFGSVFASSHTPHHRKTHSLRHQW